MHHDSSGRKLSRSCSSASASSHSIWQKNLKSRKEVKVIWQTQWKKSAVPPNLAPLQVLYYRRRRRRSHGKSPAPRDEKGSSSRRGRRSCTCPRSIEHSIYRLVGVDFSSLLVSLGVLFTSFDFFAGAGLLLLCLFRSSYFSVDVGTATTTTPATSTTVPTHVTYTLACEERRSGGGWVAG